MAIRILSLGIIVLISGCSSQRYFQDSGCVELSGSATSRAAACMAEAMFVIATNKDEPPVDENVLDEAEDKAPAKEVDPRYKQWIP